MLSVNVQQKNQKLIGEVDTGYGLNIGEVDIDRQ